jgi:formylglycine-generating enzyme
MRSIEFVVGAAVALTLLTVVTSRSVRAQDEQKKVDTPKTLITNTIGMKLKLIPAGEFQMGATRSSAQLASLFEMGSEYFDDESPRHRVRISKPFYLQTTELTQGQWESVMGTSPWTGKDYVKEGSDYAASYVSWDDAGEFCRKLSAKEGVEYRLPREGEWEYASRGGSTSMYSFGDSLGSLKHYAWYSENAADAGDIYAHRAGQKRANGFGLYDMHGNVYEWCSDWFGNDYYKSSPASDPEGPSAGSFRVFRGGGWGDSPLNVRSALRLWGSPDDRGSRMGFRVLRSFIK